jgi:CubicO group peptidase (beta-lactamase class C family)
VVLCEKDIFNLIVTSFALAGPVFGDSSRVGSGGNTHLARIPQNKVQPGVLMLLLDEPGVEERLQPIVNEAITEESIPGAILGVRSENTIWVGAPGQADTAKRVPMTPGMQVRLASVTKSFTAVLVISPHQSEPEIRYKK